MRSIYVEPTTGGYQRQENSIAYAPSAVTKANMLLLQPVGSYIYDITMGNPLIEMNKLPTKTETVAGISACLLPLTQSGDIVSVTVTSYRITVFGKAAITIQLVLPSGENAEITWTQK